MNALPDSIYAKQPPEFPIPAIDLKIESAEDLGEGVIRIQGTANGAPFKRLTQEMWGAMVGKRPTWLIHGTVVADWFSAMLENVYQQEVKNKTIIITKNEI